MSDSDLRLQELLNRPREQRLREFKYRCAQAMVFGLPVVALQLFGRSLGGAEADRWVSILQAIMSGWVLYVGATGMLFEGMIVQRKVMLLDSLIALLAVIFYFVSLISVLHIAVDGRLWFSRLFFHVVVLILACWTGFRWWQLARDEKTHAFSGGK